MAAPIFQRTVVDTQGNVVEGAVVEVRNELTDELAPIFVDRPLTDVKANPFTTDSTGFIRFFAAAGDYRIKATFGAEEIIFRFVQLIDTDELIDLNSAQTLANKTLTSPALTDPSYTGTLTGGTGVVNLGSGQLFKGTNGNVGIGTSSPTVKMQVVDSSFSVNSGLLLQGTTANNTTKTAQVKTAHFDNSQAPITALFCVNSQAANSIRIGGSFSGETAATQIIFYTAVNTTTAGGAERIRIDSSGNLLVGISDESTTGQNSVALRPGGSRISRNSTLSRVHFEFYNPNGLVGSISTSGSATFYNVQSDYRLKKDVQPVANPVDRLKQLNPVNFAWKVDGSRIDGFLAHEAQEVVPEAVTGTKDAVDKDGKPDYQGIDQSKLVPLLTAALQEAVAQIESLKARLDAANI